MELEAYCFRNKFEPAPPSDFQMDRHYLLYAQKGTLRLEAQGRRWVLPPSRAALIAAGKLVNVSILSNVTSSSVLFSKNFVQKPKTVLSVFDVSPLARELIFECQSWGKDVRKLSPYAIKIFETLYSVILELADNPSPNSLPIPRREALRKAVEYTENNFSNSFSINDIAAVSGASSRSLARYFSTEFGMTWGEYLRRVRIMKAVELLAVTDTSITEIAYTIGYNSLSAFNSAFKDIMNINPSEYRKTFMIEDR